MNPSWTDLPKELRLIILENTNLVKKHFTPNSRRDFNNVVQIIGGHLPQPARTWACAAELAFPRALFYVSRGMHDDACEAFFSQNRFILKGDMPANQRFLENLPRRATHRIRALDLQLSFDDVAKMGDQLHTIPYLERRECEWHGLIRTIRDRLDLPKLWLSIDAGNIRGELFREFGGILSEHDGYDFLNEAWYQIFAPLRQLWTPVAALKKFHVFLAWDSRYEKLAEREIMGSAYDSAVEGKLPRLSRDYNSPHEALKVENQQYRHDEVHVKFRGFDILHLLHLVHYQSRISLARGDGLQAWYSEPPGYNIWFRDSAMRSWYRGYGPYDHWLSVGGAEDFNRRTVWDYEVRCRRQKYGSEMSKSQTDEREKNLLRDEMARELIITDDETSRD